jgi:hypothetical protein
MATSKDNSKQTLTITLDRRTIEKATMIAAARSTSLHALLAREIESFVGDEEAYERAKSQAMALLDQGFHLGGKSSANRGKLHER